MFYDFPLISHIDDVLPHLEGYPEILVADRGDHTVINYMVDTGLTFGAGEYSEWTKLTKRYPEPREWKQEFTLDKGAAIRRECRGLIFTKEGFLIRRPYHKFFNANQRDETQVRYIDLNQPHTIMAKLDGSSIAPYRIGRSAPFIWGTRMGDTEVAAPVSKFANARPNYVKMAEWAERAGYTIIFEWCSPQQRIVIDHQEDQLILTGIRNNFSGVYADYIDLQKAAAHYGVPVCNIMGDGKAPTPDANVMVELVRGLAMDQFGEGIVVRFDNGHMIKVKTDEYTLIHHAKERITEERHVIADILDGVIDDVAATVLPDDADRIRKYEIKFWEGFYDYCGRLIEYMDDTYRKFERKEFAQSKKEGLTRFQIRAIFHFWDYEQFEGKPYSDSDVCEYVKKGLVRSNCGTRTKFGIMKDEVFPGVSFKY